MMGPSSIIWPAPCEVRIPAEQLSNAPRLGLPLQMFVEKRDGIRPQLMCRLLAIARPVIGEESVPGILVDLDRDILPGALRPRPQLLGLGNGRVLILFPEDAKERAGQPV